jgi:hypothetical protein
MNNIRFIQFPHPGGEHRPGSDGKSKAWNRLTKANGNDNPHARTFFIGNGARLAKGRKIEGPLWAWGEWEAEARVARRLNGADLRPSTLFEPYWVPKNSFEDLHNTDPFIFGGFYYTDCKQGTSASLMGMLELGVGSVIIFGSLVAGNGRQQWVLDTVLVVSEYVDHDLSNFEDRFRGKVPKGYDQVVLGPTYGEHSERRALPRRLYIGATYDKPVNGMFSFFPCMEPGTDKGFARPEIRASSILNDRHFNPRLGQGMKGQKRGSGSLSLDRVTELWKDIRQQLLEQGFDLGIWLDMPDSQPGRSS